ncbi:MAG: hypothetical protein AB8F94_18170 [Saprospiraceae bacterium]
MKNEILDDIFNDSLRDQLEEGEVVIWEGKPQFNNYSRMRTIGYWLLCFGLLFSNSIRKERYWLLVFTIVGVIYTGYHLFLNQKKTRYLITKLRIIFQLPKTEIQSLPFNQLDEVIVNKDGSIELLLKETYSTEIKTMDISNNTPRKNPTLELIEDVEEVASYIRNGIEDKL